MRVCPRCKLRPANSRDHIIPVVLGKICDKYGIETNYQESKNIEMVCSICNTLRQHTLLNHRGINYKHKLLKMADNNLIYLTSRERQLLKSMN